MFRDKKVRYILGCVTISIIALVIVFLLVCSLCFPDENLHFNDTASVELKDGWTLVDEDGTVRPISLPFDLEKEVGGGFTIFIKLSNRNFEGNHILIRSSSQSLVAKYNGETVYSTGTDTSIYVGNTPGSYWNIFSLPLTDEEGTLELTFASRFKDFSGSSSMIFGGTKSALMYRIFKMNGLGFIFDIILLLIGLVLFVLYLFLFRKAESSSSLRYLASFSIWLSLWFIGESRMMQFFIGNHFLVTSIAFVALAVFPLFLLLYIDKEVSFKMAVIPFVFRIILLLNVLIICILQLTGAADFFETVAVTNGLLIIFLFIIVGMLFVEVFVFKNREAKLQLIALSLFGISALIGLIMFFSSSFDFITLIIKIGATVYLAIVSITTVGKLKKLVETGNMSSYYQGLAYTDFSTSLLNRAAFYRDIERIFASATERADLTLIIMDINNLKKINDEYGHIIGDKAILSTKRCMLKSFVEVGTCYRTGGDEFACLCVTKDKRKIDEALDKFEKETALINAAGEFPFSVAVGRGEISDILADKPDNLIQTVDKYMYENKEAIKAKLNQNPNA